MIAQHLDPNPLLTAALAYAARGWQVFPVHCPDPTQPGGCSCGADPCGSPGKHPIPAHGLHNASRTGRQVQSWWEANPRANIGVRTGAVSGLIVLDIDVKQDGSTTLGALAAAYGPLPHTLTARTGSDGRHYLFKHPGFRVANDATGKLGVGVDVRGDGGYIVAAPSLHISGGPYTWVDAAAPIAALPQAWLDLLPRPAVRIVADAPSGPTPAVSEDDAAHWLDQAFLRARRGTRNATGFWLACQLRDTVRLSEADAAPLLREYAARVGGSDYTQAEALKSLQSAYKHEPREPARSQVPQATFKLVAGGRVNLDTGEITQAVVYNTPPLTVDDPVPFVDIDVLRQCILQEEYGDAKLMAQLFEDRLVFDHGRKCWLFWRGHSWQRDRTRKVVHLIGGILAAVYLRGIAECEKKIALLEAQEADAEEIAKYRKLVGQFVERAQGLRTRKRMNNVLSQAEAFLPTTGDEWDQQPTLLAVANGVIDLQTGELQAGRPRDYLCHVCPTSWLGLDTPAPRWERFLTEMFAGRPEIPAFLQRLCGVGVRGDATEHRLPILYGARGRNGKDVFLGVLEYVLGGDLASAVSKDVLVAGKGRGESAEPHLMRLQGKRLAWVSETNEHARLNAGQVKLITGGGRITARPLYGDAVSFQPSHLLWLITNYLPHGEADDDALWERLLCIECKERFVDDPSPLDPHEHARDPYLATTLKEEASGILAWLVRGHLAWQEQGLQPPTEVRQSTADYKASQDDISLFVEEMCVVGADETARASALYDAYKAWMGPREALSGKAFGERMKKKFKKEEVRTGTIYHGLKIAAQLSIKGHEEKEEF